MDSAPVFNALAIVFVLILTSWSTSTLVKWRSVKSLRTKASTTNFSVLDKDCLTIVASFLSPTELRNFSRVSSLAWNAIQSEVKTVAAKRWFDFTMKGFIEIAHGKDNSTILLLQQAIKREILISNKYISNSESEILFSEFIRLSSSCNRSSPTQAMYFDFDHGSDVYLGKFHSINKLNKSMSFQVKVVTLSVGLNHAAFSVVNGDMFTLGSGEFGQLGNCECTERFPSRTNIYRFMMRRPEICFNVFPVKVSLLKDHFIVAISCGKAHTAALTLQGKVFTFGKTDNGCLGHDRWTDSYFGCCYKPGEVEFDLLDKTSQKPFCIDVICCENYTCLIDSKFNVWLSGFRIEEQNVEENIQDPVDKACIHGSSIDILKPCFGLCLTREAFVRKKHRQSCIMPYPMIDLTMQCSANYIQVTSKNCENANALPISRKIEILRPLTSFVVT